MMVLGILLALAVHEAGHALAVRAIGEKPRLRLHWRGAAIVWNGADRSGKARAFVSLAGPGMSLLTVALFWGVGLEFAALASLELGVLNLFLTEKCDGRRALRALREG